MSLAKKEEKFLLEIRWIIGMAIFYPVNLNLYENDKVGLFTNMFGNFRTTFPGRVTITNSKIIISSIGFYHSILLKDIKYISTGKINFLLSSVKYLLIRYYDDKRIEKHFGLSGSFGRITKIKGKLIELGVGVKGRKEG